MHFALTEEQQALQDMARRFLEEASSPGQVCATMETELGYDPEVWRDVCQELGWPAIAVPESCGGYGYGAVEQGVVLEEMGRTVFCSPFFSTVCLAVNALLVAGNSDQQSRWLAPMVSGERTGTVAWMERGARWDGVGMASRSRRVGGDYVLTGTKHYVVDGHSADLVIVAAPLEGPDGPSGMGLYAVPGDAPGLSRRVCATMDQTRRLAVLELDGVRVPDDAVLGDPNGSEWALERLLDLAGVGLASEQLGGAERCMEMAVEYAKVRTQFSRPIGSFQAIKHLCADMLVAVESARSAAWNASWMAAQSEEALAVAASQAQATCSAAYFRCAADALQIHGGIGFTWEHPIHLYLKRARASEAFLGDPGWHRARFADRIGL